MQGMTANASAQNRNRNVKETTTGGQCATEQKPEATVSLPGPSHKSPAEALNELCSQQVTPACCTSD